MQLQFTEEQFKENTKRMLAYLKEQGIAVPLSKGYEATSRFCGVKSWNVLAEQFKREYAANEKQTQGSPYYVSKKEGLRPATISAKVFSDDQVWEAEFDAFDYFADTNLPTLMELDRERWGACEEADDVARHFEDTDEAVGDVFKYLERVRGDVGFEVYLDDTDVLCAVKAFNYALWVQFTLCKLAHVCSMDLPNWMSKAGIMVAQERDAEGNSLGWFYQQANQPRSMLYPTEAGAWIALGLHLENTEWVNSWFIHARVLDVLGNSGCYR